LTAPSRWRTERDVQSENVPRRRIVIDHVSVGVSDLERSREFYRRTLKPLGFSERGPWRDGAQEVTFGLEEADDFAISAAYAPVGSVHIAFAADGPEQVDAFYEAAIAAGGRNNGPPGLRHEYSEGYYGAFVLDPDGHNIEAVHHARA
jgi:catechol 2,3-dioxygenase-like lactoylglutathione lyase family enzyme